MNSILAFNITITADAVAWYAAIVATLGSLVTGYAVWRDRARVKVLARPNMKITESWGDYSKGRTYIFIEVANVGRRPVHLQGLPWFTVKGQKKPVYAVKSRWEPKDLLDEGENATMLCDQESLKVDLSTLDKIIVRDATGRKWKGTMEGA